MRCQEELTNVILCPGGPRPAHAIVVLVASSILHAKSPFPFLREQVIPSAKHHPLLLCLSQPADALLSSIAPTRSRELVDKRHLLEIEEQKRRAEADKLAALTALEKRSREFMVEKNAKKELESKIAAMQGQVLVGGEKLENVPQVGQGLKGLERFSEGARLRCCRALGW